MSMEEDGGWMIPCHRRRRGRDQDSAASTTRIRTGCSGSTLHLRPRPGLWNYLTQSLSTHCTSRSLSRWTRSLMQHPRMNLYFTTSHIHLPFLQRSRFLQSISNLASLGSAPSLSLVFAILAISAPYHNDPSVRARSDGWYTQSKESLDRAVLTGLSAEGGKGSLTVEMVQVRPFCSSPACSPLT